MLCASIPKPFGRRFLLLAVLACGLTLAAPVAGQRAAPCAPAAQALLEQARTAQRDEGDLDRAIRLLAQAIGIDRTCLTAHLALAEAYMLAERHTDAIPVLQAALALSPDHGRAAQDLLAALFWAGRYEQAVEFGEAHHTLLGAFDLSLLGYYMGRAYMKLERYEEAVRWFESGLAFERSGLVGVIEAELVEAYALLLKRHYDPQVALKLGRLLYERFRPDDAARVLRELVQRAPDSAPAYYWLGLASIELARRADAPPDRQALLDEARRALERYLQLAPDGEHAAEARRLLREMGR